MSNGSTYKSRTAETFDKLRDAIVRARFLPGEKLRIDHLCEAFEASSGAVREALSRLTAEGLVSAEPQKGFTVAPISRRDLIDLTEVRVAVEVRCLQESIKHGDIEWEARVLSARHRLHPPSKKSACGGARDSGEWHAFHMQFHAALVSACPNAYWRQLREMMFVRSERYRHLSAPVAEGNRSIRAEHNEIANAALTRDVKKACATMKTHLELTMEILLKSKLPFAESKS